MKNYPIEVIKVAESMYGCHYCEGDLAEIQRLGEPDKYWRIYIGRDMEIILQSEKDALERIEDDKNIPLVRTEYVLGFYFSTDKKTVTLIRKNRPEKFAGKWNGVGGKIEQNERPQDAMVREFYEETDLKVQSWRHFAQFQTDHYTVYVYVAFGDLIPKTKTDELVERFLVSEILDHTTPQKPKIDNIAWLIPMALDPNIQFSNTFKTK